MRSHKIGPVTVTLRETARTEEESQTDFTICDADGALLANGDASCPAEMNPEGLQSAYELLLWLTTEDDAGDADDPEWQELCSARHRCIIDEDLWEELQPEIATYAMAFEIAAWEVKDEQT